MQDILQGTKIRETSKNIPIWYGKYITAQISEIEKQNKSGSNV